MNKFILILILLIMTTIDNIEAKKLEKITLGAGCFWCIEAIFDQLKGVENVQSGYSGGALKNPTYKEVCTGSTGHAEVVQITYDSEIIEVVEILEVFWSVHDPTTLNRQGADVGTQYRSAIFYHNAKQKQLAEDYLKQLDLEGIFTNPIVTEITKFEIFYPAEDYHEDYYKRNGNQPYCKMVVRPKVNKFREKFEKKLKK